MLEIAIKNILSHKLKSLLVILGMIVGICSVVTVLSIGNSGSKEINNLISSLGLDGIIVSENGVGLNYKGIFTNEDILLLQNSNKNISSVMPLVYKSIKIQNRNNYLKGFIFGLGEDYNNIIESTLVYGTNFSPNDLLFGKNVCIIDTVTAKKLFGRENITGKEISVYIDNTQISLTVCGIISSNSAIGSIVNSYASNLIFLPIETINNLTSNNNYSSIAVSLNQNSNSDIVKTEIENLFTDYKGINNLQIQNMSAQQGQMNDIVKWITGILTAIASVSVIVGGFGIMSVMLSNISERKKEIGIKLAVGATAKDILYEFLLEAILLSLLSGIIGIIFSIICSALIGNFIGFSIKVDLLTAIISLIFCVIIGIIFSVYPANKAASLNPIDCLRNE